MSCFEKKSVSYIIVCYNSLADLIPCIESIIYHSEPDIKHEVIVVDNSEQEEARIIENKVRYFFSDKVKYFYTGRNVGYGAGNNYGIQKAQSDVIFVVNPDVRLKSPVASAALADFEKNSELALIGFSQNGGFDLSFYFYPHIFIPLIGGLINKILNKFKVFNRYLSFPSGACVAIQKSKFLKIGGYDENFFLYCEDADLSRRFLQAGLKVSIDFSISYKHLIDVYSRRNRSMKSIEIERESLIYYLRKNNFSIPIYMKLYTAERVVKRILNFKYAFQSKK